MDFHQTGRVLCSLCFYLLEYSDRQTMVTDPGLHCLPFIRQCFDTGIERNLFKFYDKYGFGIKVSRAQLFKALLA